MAILLADRYRLNSELASSGMASVWLATDEVLARNVAVKLMHSHLASDADFRGRFEQEAVAAARLVHPHVVSIFDTGSHDDVPFIVMEYLGGGTLRDRIEEGPSLEENALAAIGSDVCSALAYAHENGVIHRDIKPANLLFSETGVIKVADFGIARAAFGKKDLTQSGEMLGTVRYVSPEQVKGEEVDARSDLYSLGVVLYECVTGKAPFQAPNDVALANMRVEHDPISPRDIKPSVSKELDRIIMKALSRDRASRFASADEMGASLSALQDGATDPRPRTQSLSRMEDVSYVRSEFRWIIPAVIALALAVVLVAVPQLRERLGSLLGGPLGGVPREESVPLAVEAWGAYDPPPGDSEENDRQVERAFDGDIDTFWKTESYSRPALGGKKDGVGIYLDLGEPRKLSAIEVVSVTEGWRGAVRTSDDGRSWSEPTQETEVSDDSPIETSERARYFMIWITNLVVTEGQGSSENPYSVGIKEIRPKA